MGTKENRVKNACMQVLLLRGVFAWLNNTGAMRAKDAKGKTRFIRFGAEGSPDIMGILPGGRFIGVECKQPLGPRGGDSHSRQSPEQIAWQEECEKAGGLYVLARSVEDVERALEVKP